MRKLSVPLCAAFIFALGCQPRESVVVEKRKPPTSSTAIAPPDSGQPPLKVEPSTEPTKTTPSKPAPLPRGAVMLFIKLKPGMKLRYTVDTTEYRGGQSNVKGRYDYFINVKSLKAEGIWNATLTFGNFTADVESDGFAKVKWTSAKKDLQAMQSLVTTGMAFGVAGIRYPEAAIKPGSVWQDNLDAAKIVALCLGSNAITTEENWIPILFRFSKYGLRNGKKVAVITYSENGKAKIQNGTFEVSGRGTVEVDVTSSLPVYAKSDSTSTLVQNGTKVTRSALTTVRLAK